MRKTKARTSVVTRVRPAGHSAGVDHQVLSLKVTGGSYRREPCRDCPWRKDAVGIFPAAAFAHSAGTAGVADLLSSGGDLATDLNAMMAQFACHESGKDKPAVCAGYILCGSDALGWRMAAARGVFDPREVSDGGHDLFADYRAMAEANGVDPDDPALRLLRHSVRHFGSSD